MLASRVNGKHWTFDHLHYSSKASKMSFRLALEVMHFPLFCYIVFINMLDFNELSMEVHSKL
jgi:hypothetical protein